MKSCLSLVTLLTFILITTVVDGNTDISSVLADWLKVAHVESRESTGTEFPDGQFDDFTDYLNELIREYELRKEKVPPTEFLYAKWKFQNNITSYDGSCEYEIHEKTFPGPITEDALVLLARMEGTANYCKSKCTSAGDDCAAMYYDRQYGTCSVFYRYDAANIRPVNHLPYDLYIKTTCSP